MAGDVVLTWTVVAFVMALIMRRGGCCGTKLGAAGDGSGVVGCGCS
jgi:hypothetical protein